MSILLANDICWFEITVDDILFKIEETTKREETTNSDKVRSLGNALHIYAVLFSE
jgi:hypothetical protein